MAYLNELSELSIEEESENYNADLAISLLNLEEVPIVTIRYNKPLKKRN